MILKRVQIISKLLLEESSFTNLNFKPEKISGIREQMRLATY